jgi:DNA-binding response OmpR family regulator
MCILLVEDEWLIRELLAEELQEHGYVVHEAQNGDHAVGIFPDLPETFTLLITDIHMPGDRNGLDVARLVHHHHPLVSIIYTTGRPDSLSGLDMLRSHDALLRKPYRLSEVMSLVKQFYPLAG